jgi:hypothetical protein
MEIIKIKRNGISRGQKYNINNYKVERKEKWKEYMIEKNALELDGKLEWKKWYHHYYEHNTLPNKKSNESMNKLECIGLDIRNLIRNQHRERFWLNNRIVNVNFPNIKMIKAINGECFFEGSISLLFLEDYKDIIEYGCVIGTTNYNWYDFVYHINWKDPIIYLVKREVDLNINDIRDIRFDKYIVHRLINYYLQEHEHMHSFTDHNSIVYYDDLKYIHDSTQIKTDDDQNSQRILTLTKVRKESRGRLIFLIIK